MIVGFILTFIFNILIILIGQVPDLTFSADFVSNFDIILSVLIEMVQIVAFFIPLNALYMLFLIKISVDMFRIAWALFLRIKSFIPTIAST